MEKVWIDVSDHREARLLSYVARALSKKADIVVTCSALPQPQAVLRAEGIGFQQLDDPSSDTLDHYGERIVLLSSFVSKVEPDLLLSDLEPAAVRTAFGLGIPVWAFYREALDSRDLSLLSMSYPLCERVFASSFFGEGELASAGVDRASICSFRGWNECYLKDYRPGRTPKPLANRIPRVMIRSQGNGNRWMAGFLKGILRSNPNLSITLLGGGCPSSLLRRFPGVKAKDFLPNLPPYGQHVFLGSGRMLAESFVLGVPTIGTDGRRYEDLGLLYDSITCDDDPEELVEKCTDLLDIERQKRFGLQSRAVVSTLESPVECLLSYV